MWDRLSSCLLYATWVFLKAVAYDRSSPRRSMAKYCRILCIASHMNSPALGLFWWHVIVLCLILGQALSPVLPCRAPAHPHAARMWGSSTDLCSWDGNGQDFTSCEFLLDPKEQLISLSLLRYSFVQKMALVSSVQVPSEEILLYEYWVLTLSIYCLDTADSAMCFTKQNKPLQRIVLRELRGEIPNTDSRAGDILFFLCSWG